MDAKSKTPNFYGIAELVKDQPIQNQIGLN